MTDSTKQQKLPSFDDSSLAFLDSDGDALLDRKAIWSCLPKLLEERRVGKVSRIIVCLKKWGIFSHIFIYF